MNQLLKKATVFFTLLGLLALGVTAAGAQTVTPAPGAATTTGGWLGWPWWVWILLGLLLLLLLWWIFGRRPAAPPVAPPAARRVTTLEPPPASVYDAPAAPVVDVTPESPVANVAPMTPAMNVVPEPPLPSEEAVMRATNDLKLIEGIGPRIEQVLNDAGITTFEDLGATTAERLRELLNAAGLRGSFGDPTTWGEQARLAAEGRWDELQTLQDSLRGGR